MTTQPYQLASPSGGLPSAVLWAQLLMRDRIGEGDVVVDATLGNGHDTVFLAELVGGGGHVHGFDVQEAAMESTRQRLASEGIPESKHTLHHASHSEMTERLPEEHLKRLRGVMFNLGYLPGSDKTVITETDETMAAVIAALERLQPGGLMTVVVYPGHEGGAQEAKALGDWAVSLSPREVEVQNLRPVNRSAAPPECWAFWKRDS